MDHADYSVHAVDVGEALAAADHRLAGCGSMLERHVVLGPSRLLDDETVARVRALAADLAVQLAGGDHALADAMRDMLAGNRAILLHLHALAVEWQTAAELAVRRAIDPLLPPLVRRRLDAQAVGHDVAAVTTALLAAQTRVSGALRRMRLPLAELPGDLQQLARACAGTARADRAIDEQGRLALLHRVLTDLGDDFGLALRVDHAGLPLFLSALSLAAQTPREVVALAMAEDDAIRLALLLRAAGLDRAEAGAQLLAIRPDAEPALVDLAADAQHAARLLADGAR